MRNADYYFTLLLIVLTSCGKVKEQKEQLLINNAVSELKEEKGSEILLLGSRNIEIYPITKEEYDRYPSEYKIFGFDGDEEVINDSSVLRKADSLLFTLTNNERIVFKNDSSEEEEWTIYQYEADLEEIDLWSIHVTYYEWWNTILLNKNNGDTTLTIGSPAVSPNEDYMLCGNNDLQANFTLNGLELFSINNASEVKLEGTLELTDWGPIEMKWVHEDTVFVKQAKLDSSYNEFVDYAKIAFVKNDDK